MMDSQFPQDSQIQDLYSMFQVPQEEEPMGSDKSLKNLIQSENNFFQSVNRVEAQMSRLINKVKERNEEFYLIHVRPFPIALTILMKPKNYGVYETLTNIQFHHINLNLTNSKPGTNW